MADIKKILADKREDIDKKIEEFIPRKLTKENVMQCCGKPRYAFDVETMTAAVNGPIWDMLDRGGKRWRPTLFLLCYEAFGGDTKKVMDFVVIPEVVHNGTLLVDDVEDDSAIRRGKPCTHKIYGVDVAVNAGNAMYFLPLLALKKNRDKFSKDIIIRAYEIYSQEMMNLSYGQGMDIWWHKGKKENVTDDEYLQMCAYKTGTLARMSAKLGALLGGANEKEIELVGKIAEAIGVAFQIQDDVLNLTGERFGQGKGVGEDVHEGKRSLIVIHALQRADKKSAARLREILLMHTSDQKIIDEAIAIMKRAGSIEYATGVAKKIVRDAWMELEPVLKPSPAKDTLKSFADYMVEREI